jgi:hypothetical protein
MPFVAGAAHFAVAASDVDLADDPTADKFGPAGRRTDDSGKLMADGSRETGITADDFEVGIAYAGSNDADDTFVSIFRDLLLLDRESRAVESERVHHQ